MNSQDYNNELYHYGVLGMKWGRRKDRYTSGGLRSAYAKRQNAKVDASFKKWKENSAKRDNTVELGKKANESRRAYENNKTDKALKKQYKEDNKAYKKALKENTTYRKGQVKKQVESDLSRKYLSEAKKVKKQMESDPSNKELQKKYNDLMGKHDIERAKARRAPEVAAKRSAKKAAIKRGLTISAKAAAATAATTLGAYAVNRYLTKNDFKLNGKPIRISTENISSVVNFAKKTKDFLGYF